MRTIQKFFKFTCLCVGLGLLNQAISTEGATATVIVGNGGGLTFSPAITNISIHDSVIWTWSGSFHSTTSGTDGSPTGDGLWNSNVHNPPYSYTNTFDTAGTFPYYCSVHFASGMKGTIVVTNAVAPNLPPTVTITNPASGTTLSAPASLTLAASADDSDGSIATVQFFQGATSLGNVTAAPFSMAVNNLAAGDYTFSAVASDNLGATATNAIVVHVINAGPVAVSAPAFATADHFQFSYTADIGLSYVVQVSTNLLDWTPLTTNTATVSPVIFTDPNAGGGAAFYRVERRPNP